MDTHGKFRSERVKSLERLGVPQELYDKTRQHAHDGVKGEGVYQNRLHARAIAAFGFDEEKVYQALMVTLEPEKIKKCLYSDTIDFLEKLKNFNQKRILLSFGSPEFQKQKIKALDLEKYFDQVILTNEPKEIKLKKILSEIDERPVWFINDRIVENIEASKFKEVRVLQTIFPFVSKEKYVETGLPYFETLTEIYDFITSSIK